MDVEEELHKIHEAILKLYPKAVSVNIFVNDEGIQAEPTYKTDAAGFSMKNISGDWIKKSGENK